MIFYFENSSRPPGQAGLTAFILTLIQFASDQFSFQSVVILEIKSLSFLLLRVITLEILIIFRSILVLETNRFYSP